MPEIYNDSDGHLVVYLNTGAPGPGLPPGGTVGQIPVKSGTANYQVSWEDAPDGVVAIVGPASSVNNRLIAFNGTTGKLGKDSGILISDVFTTTQATTKVDKVTGKGLSANDYTDADKAKVAAATAENFRGEYPTLLALTTAVPSGNLGDYAFISSVGVDLKVAFWDTLNSVWDVPSAFVLTGQDVADVVFNTTDAAGWTQTDTRIYTTAEKTAVAGAASLDYVNSLALAAGVLTPAYTALSYFDLTGTVIPIISVSDGVTNLVKVAPTTTLDAASALFDSPVAGRLRYTGASSRLFVVTFTLSFNGPASSEMVVALAKNGSALPTSKAIVTGNTNTVPVSVTTLVSLITNDYIEVFVGNTTNVNDPTIKTLTIEASPA